jgi:hypothetical protein
LELKMLKLPGKIFDIVDIIVHEMPYMVSTPTLHDMEILAKNSRETVAWDDSCWELVKALGEYPTGEKLFDAYWRTLVFNTECSGEAPPDLKISYKAWISSFILFNEAREISQQVQQLARDDVRPRPPSTWGWIEGFAKRIAANWRGFTLMVLMLRRMEIANKEIKAAERFTEAFKNLSAGRKFFTTANSYMGWVPSAAQIGDCLCYFEGCPLPFVIRRREGGHELVGDCYIHGLMYEPPKELDMSSMEPITLI